MGECEVNRKHLQGLSNIIRFDDAYNKAFDRNVLNAEAKIILCLSKDGSMSVKDAMHNSKLSQRAFYLTLDRMKKLSMVIVTQDDNDARVRNISLGREFQKRLLEVYTRSFRTSDLADGTLSAA